jgi:radical SAM superfamily enzyme YgiQ (UPF0313 family)
MRAVLISTYDLGHQPFGLASAAAWLQAEGCAVILIDLAVERFDPADVVSADLIGFYLPMHTATRLAVPLIREIRAVNRHAHLSGFGLYAPLNRDLLYRLGVDSVIGGEFEQPLSHLCRRLAGDVADPPNGPISLVKQRFKEPLRSGLPALSRYATLTLPDGTVKPVGFTEASRGCKHFCRHCPIVSVYDGRFFIVQRDVVLADIRQQVADGAAHISFGDPDFFNGTGHARAVVEALHREFPDLTFDVTIKIEHLLKHADLLPLLRDAGCLFVTSAIESVDDHTLARLDKGHSRADFLRVVENFRVLGLFLAPTFVAFSPWLTLEGYLDLLRIIDEYGLVESVAPVQLAIRLLIPAGSRLLALPEIRDAIDRYDEEMLYFPWAHKDPQVEALYGEVNDIVQCGAECGTARPAVFDQILERALTAAGKVRDAARRERSYPAVPQMSEPWYCCAEPTPRQRSAY